MSTDPSAVPPFGPFGPPGPPGAPEPIPVPPYLLEWARQTFDMEEFMKGVREIEAGGGLRLEDFIDEIEARALGK